MSVFQPQHLHIRSATGFLAQASASKSAHDIQEESTIKTPAPYGAVDTQL